MDKGKRIKRSTLATTTEIMESGNGAASVVDACNRTISEVEREESRSSSQSKGWNTLADWDLKCTWQ